MTFTDVDGDIQAQQFGVPSGTNETVPAGYQMVTRTAIVRLGPSLHIHTSDHHASVGVTDIASTKDANNEYVLKVWTDFDESREFVLYAAAIPDQSLTKKGLLPAGASGGSGTTIFRLQSCKAITYGTSSSYAAGVALPAHSSCFNSNVDNVWVQIVSLRRLAA